MCVCVVGGGVEESGNLNGRRCGLEMTRVEGDGGLFSQ